MPGLSSLSAFGLETYSKVSLLYQQPQLLHGDTAINGSQSTQSQFTWSKHELKADKLIYMLFEAGSEQKKLHYTNKSNKDPSSYRKSPAKIKGFKSFPTLLKSVLQNGDTVRKYLQGAT